MLKKGIGFFLYSICKHLPASYKRGGKLWKSMRNFCARLIMADCGENINIEKGASFSSKCTIGDNSGIGINSKLGITHIGDNVLMGPECLILTRNHEFLEVDTLIIKQGYTEERPVYIGDDVWIGQRVIILPGIHIADGTVIGAGAVVTKDTVPYSVVAGNPARVIKMRTGLSNKKKEDKRI